MSIFESVGQPDMRQLIQQIKANPGAMLQKKGFKIPQGMNDPNQIIQHLCQSGQVQSQRVQQIMQRLGRR